ncbi:MAG TPA: VWA domain-containing protein [Bryobacteraceae bacterium]|nr:VWA domain-containing protein [Bryobacteraceae bacterium]
MFEPGTLSASSEVPGSHLQGGFVNFETLVQGLSHGAVPDIPVDSSAREQATQKPAIATDSNALFRTTARLVQVYALVTDDRGRYMDDLSRDQFTVLDNGQPVTTVAFENRVTGISCALILDTTESMRAALPALKNAALGLIGSLRSTDAVAVYGLGNGFSQLQPFTLDKAAAKRAVLESDASGMTALYDALVYVNRDLSARTGKKVMVVITDGDDNFSTLTRDIAIRRAEMNGVPIYTLPMGTAIKNPTLLKELIALSQATGGVSYPIESIKEIESTFEKVLQDLPHGYLLTVQPPPVEDTGWRSIEVILNPSKGQRVRARSGYYPQ